MLNKCIKLNEMPNVIPFNPEQTPADNTWGKSRIQHFPSPGGDIIGGGEVST